MITDMASYLRFFDSVSRRTRRDIAALPPAAAAWRPPASAGEGSWTIGQIVGHIGGTRLYFASAYRGEGWIKDPHELAREDRATWLPWLDETGARYAALLRDTPPAWLTRKVAMIDTPGETLSGWRLLMMMIEHEVHHRSQIDTYAGLNKWEVPHIYGRSAEQVGAERERQRARHAES